MPNFVLLDPCLHSVGGHYYQYAQDILTTAEQCGYRPVLALRREFPATEAFRPTWRIFRVFQFGFQTNHSAGIDGKSRHPIGSDGRWLDADQVWQITRWLDVPRLHDRRRRLLAFESACAAVFHEIGWHADDVAFLPTMSEFELLGLVRFLAAHSASERLAWHVQMHFDILAGREPAHAQQCARLQLVHRQMSAALARIPRHRLYFYSTTDAMCRQYNRLAIAPFRTLPYPARAAKQPLWLPNDGSRPLRVTVAGGLRREKGKHQIHRLVQSLWDEFLASGRVQLWLQINPADVPRRLPSVAVAATDVLNQVQAGSNAPIVAVPHPLSTADYDRLIRDTDVGLFIYESERYHSRCSGILVEMLAAGVNVIVPGGTWLAEQIAEADFDYVDYLDRDVKVVERRRIPWICSPFGGARSPSACFNDEVVFDAEEPAIADIRIPTGAVQALISYAWSGGNCPGRYLRLETLDPAPTTNRETPTHTMILGSRGAVQPVRVLAPLSPKQSALRLQLRNAFDSTPIRLSDTYVSFLAAPAGQPSYPLGCVGMTTADIRQVPVALRDILLHRIHYRKSGIAFSGLWRDAHAPQRTIKILEAAGAGETHRASSAAA
jgi:hypothetical protein